MLKGCRQVWVLPSEAIPDVIDNPDEYALVETRKPSMDRHVVRRAEPNRLRLLVRASVRELDVMLIEDDALATDDASVVGCSENATIEKRFSIHPLLMFVGA